MSLFPLQNKRNFYCFQLSNKSKYDIWASFYDDVQNKTRDVSSLSVEMFVKNKHFIHTLEIGCGTGLNTKYLVESGENIIAIDFSEQMLLKAKEKIVSAKVTFLNKDITKDWDFVNDKMELVLCCLVLEHIQDIESVFKKVYSVLKKGGIFFISELHPFKQYMGSKARFEKENRLEILECFTHNISDFFLAGKRQKFSLLDINELYDDENTSFPRILTLQFIK